MRKIWMSLLIIFTLSLYGCNNNKSEPIVNENSPESLEGTWRLISYIDHGIGATDWASYSDDVIYEKYITPTHFTWVKYEKSKDELVGTGGGTFEFKDGTYTEDIQFFYPPGSSILGQTIPFSVDFKEGKWYHTGYAKNIEFNPETGDMVVVDSSKIEEIWEKVISERQDQIDLVGSWELVSYKESEDSIWLEHPEFFGYIKHVTPTHFSWVHYNKEGDEVFAQGGGTCNVENGKYIEKINYMYPGGSRLIGTTIPFQMEFKDGLWHHEGYLREVEKDAATGNMIVVDSTKIKEIWKKL